MRAYTPAALAEANARQVFMPRNPLKLSWQVASVTSGRPPDKTAPPAVVPTRPCVGQGAHGRPWTPASLFSCKGVDTAVMGDANPVRIQLTAMAGAGAGHDRFSSVALSPDGRQIDHGIRRQDRTALGRSYLPAAGRDHLEHIFEQAFPHGLDVHEAVHGWRLRLAFEEGTTTRGPSDIRFDSPVPDDPRMPPSPSPRPRLCSSWAC